MQGRQLLDAHKNKLNSHHPGSTLSRSAATGMPTGTPTGTPHKKAGKYRLPGAS
ncbi:hypothetical protein [Syntrophaceticus schinkii]|uniref:hypothetical protein n=1 Tax=Syntrophaceticus schinkii TaxID=499207 RepID=UPI0012EC8735|nr:hypothetical protein [Syntrophaceticus schinkii]